MQSVDQAAVTLKKTEANEPPLASRLTVAEDDLSWINALMPPDTYVVIDQNLHDRMAQPLPCRTCKCMQVKRSRILDTVVTLCGAVDVGAPNGALLEGLMRSLAIKDGCCHAFKSLFGEEHGSNDQGCR